MKAHGVEYASKAEAEARIADINTEIFQHGVSDGRVTEILCIIDMLQQEGLEEAPVLPPKPKPPIDWAFEARKRSREAWFVVDETAGIIVSGGWIREEYAEELAWNRERYQVSGPDAHEFGVTYFPSDEMYKEYEESGRGEW